MENKKEKIAEHIKQIMSILEMEVKDDTLNTPKRVAKMYVDELFKHINNNGIEELTSTMTTFPSKNHNVIRMEGIKFNSVCSHHLMPFSGLVSVEYTPSETIIGLSKIPRVVKFFSKKPQVQENLTNEIGEYLWSILKPKHLKVTLYDVKHTCVSCRGIESDGEVTTEFDRHMIVRSKEERYE